MSIWLRAFFVSAFLALGIGAAFANEATTYTYDALGRLTAMSSTGTVNNGQNVSTNFDPAGNRTNYTVNGSSISTPTISIANASATEGGTLNFVVTRTGSVAAAATVNFATSDGTAVAPGDYTQTSGTLTIPVGQASATIAVTTIDDTLVEGTETMSVTISNPSGGASIGTGPATGTIYDNDSGLAIGNASVTEGGTLVFTVTRTGSISGTSSASYATASGTATSGSDFTPATGTISFAANQTSATINVATIDDTLVENTETMTVNLSNPSSGTFIIAATGTGTIIDNDLAPPTIPGSYAMTAGTVTPGLSGYSDGTIGGTAARGSLSPSAIGSGYVISSVLGAGNRSGQVSFSIASPSGHSALPNSGWTSITIPGVGTLTRTSATYTTVADTTGRQTAQWTWPNAFLTANSGTVVIQ